MERRNAWLSYKEAEEAEMEKLAKAYREFLDKGITERDEDKEFIARKYSYVFIGIMLDWIKGDMKEDPSLIIDKLALLI